MQFDRHCFWVYHLARSEFVEECDESRDFFDRLDLSKLDTGFFNLYLTSNAHITNNTVVKNLQAQNHAIASVIG